MCDLMEIMVVREREIVLTKGRSVWVKSRWASD